MIGRAAALEGLKSSASLSCIFAESGAFEHKKDSACAVLNFDGEGKRRRPVLPCS